MFQKSIFITEDQTAEAHTVASPGLGGEFTSLAWLGSGWGEGYLDIPPGAAAPVNQIRISGREQNEMKNKHHTMHIMHNMQKVEKRQKMSDLPIVSSNLLHSHRLGWMYLNHGTSALSVPEQASQKENAIIWGTLND